MNGALFVGVYPGLTKEMLDFMLEVISEFIRNAVKQSTTSDTRCK